MLLLDSASTIFGPAWKRLTLQAGCEHDDALETSAGGREESILRA
jgi:hypothetical protein